MRLVHISDTHGKHIQLPDLSTEDTTDVLIHTGDFTCYHDPNLLEFYDWFSSFPHEHKIIVPGNHDWELLRVWEDKKLDDYIQTMSQRGIEILVDREIEIQGIKFYGTPWQPIFFDWAFNLPDHMLREKYARIPDDTAILLTHTPPFGVLDHNRDGIRCGSEELEIRIRDLPNLKANLFGHIHESYGLIERDGVIYSNAALEKDSFSMSLKEPIVIELDKG